MDSPGKNTIIWFTNTACAASPSLGVAQHTGGWLLGLESELRKNPLIDLHICFYHFSSVAPFVLNGVTYHPVLRKQGKTNKVLRRLFPLMNDLKELNALKEVLRMVKPDVIHIHGTEDNFGLLQVTVPTPSVVSIQGLLTEVTKHFYGGFNESEIAKKENFRARLLFKTFKKQLKALQKKAGREIKILQNTSFLIGRTEWDKSVSAQFTKRARYFHCDEILRDEFYLDKTNGRSVLHDRATFKILTTVNSTLYKGLDMVLLALKKIGNQLPVTWHVVGLNENDSIVRLTEQLTGVNISEIPIHFHGMKSAQDLRQLLSETHLFCQTSYIENSSNSLCEAMCTGVPTLASDCGGTRTLLNDGQLGALFATGDVDSLCHNIMDLYKNYDNVSQRATSVREIALKRHDPSEVGKRTFDIYNQLINNTPTIHHA
jgi:glycosyltransferase involved in cell wall biosynthesis